MFFQFRYVFVVIFITSSFAARDVSMKFPPMNFVDEEEHKDHDDNQCEHDHVIEELDGLHASIKPLIDKTEMIGKHMRGFKGPKDKREWELEPSFEDFYYTDKRGLRKFLGAKGKKSFHETLEDEENRLDNEMVRNSRYYYLNYPLEASKRGRSMFQGNRGKKGYQSNIWEKKAALSFQPFRGKRSMMDKLRELAKQDSFDSQGEKELEEYVQGPYGYLLTNFYNKREPVAYRRSYGKIFADKRLRKGYTGLRGKRNIIAAYEGGAESTQQEVIDRNIVKDSGELFPFKKRTPYFFSGTHTKFVGARGKKWKPDSCEGAFY